MADRLGEFSSSTFCGLNVVEAKDKVIYQILLDQIPIIQNSNQKSSDGKISHRNVLEKVRIECLGYISRLTEGYIWHKEGFNLDIVVGGEEDDSTLDEGQSLPCLHLQGATEFGDNIEDEWFITWLLFQFSKRRKDITIRVIDSDGQFLLIEAGNYVPGWLTPDIGDTRVFIRAGKLVIIPRPETPTQALDIPARLTLAKAFNIVREERHVLKECEMNPIRAAVFSRMEGFPESAYKSNSHYFRVILPRRAGEILKSNPWLVAPCTRAYCGRDTLDIRSTRKMPFLIGGQHGGDSSRTTATTTTTTTTTTTSAASSSTPASNTTATTTSTSTATSATFPCDLICMRLRSTRLLYAQLKHQKPPNLPEPIRKAARDIILEKIPQSQNKRKKALNLGISLAFGIEILYQRAIKMGGPAAAAAAAASSSTELNNFENTSIDNDVVDDNERGDDKNAKTKINKTKITINTCGKQEKKKEYQKKQHKLAWESYLDALTKRGWFQGYLEYSKPWNERLTIAKNNFNHLLSKRREQQQHIESSSSTVFALSSSSSSSSTAGDKNYKSSHDTKKGIEEEEEEEEGEGQEKLKQQKQGERRKRQKRKPNNRRPIFSGEANDELLRCLKAIITSSLSSARSSSGSHENNNNNHSSSIGNQNSSRKTSTAMVFGGIDKDQFEQLGKDDGDEWMNLTPDSLDSLLSSRGADSTKDGDNDDDGNGDEFKTKSDSKDGLEEYSSVLSDMAKRMNEFVSQQSSYEGVEVCENDDDKGRNRRRRKERLQGREYDDDNDGKDGDDDYGTDNSISFDFSKVLKALVQIKNDEEEKPPLATGNVGKSDYSSTNDDDDFEEIEKVKSRTSTRFFSYMETMDAEVYSAGLGKEFVRNNQSYLPSSALPPAAAATTNGHHPEKKNDGDIASGDGSGEDDSHLRPVDVNLNLVQHLLESYSSQAGLPGPTSSLLGSLGIKLPDDADRRGGGEINTREKKSLAK